MFNADQMSEMFMYVALAHSDHPKTPDKAFRNFDGKTPFAVHPWWAALTMLQEAAFKPDIRVIRALALSCHDILEITDAELPPWAKEPEVKRRIESLTFSDDEDPSVEIWNRGEEAILLKFYDVTANLMSINYMPAVQVEERRTQALVHLRYVEERHAELEIIKIARGLLGLPGIS